MARLTVLLCAAMLLNHQGSAPETTGPSFAEPIPNVTVAAGREITLPCVVDNLENYKVAWIHTDRHTLLTLHDKVITRNPRYSINHNGYRTWWLHIVNVEQGDSGKYMCQINTSPMKSQVGYLEVVVPPKVDEGYTSSDTEVREGGDVTLRCKATGSPLPKIKWRREDQKEIPVGAAPTGTGPKTVPAVDGEYLNINKVSRLHMGAYLCIASNGVQPSVSKRIMLNVNFAPMIWIPNQLVGAPLETDVLLDCGLESHPRSVTYWNREGGVMILSNSKYDSVLVETGSYKAQMRLRIKNLGPDDYGSYVCVAKNSLGETAGTIKLYEIPRPTTTSSTVPQYTIKTSRTDAANQHTTSEKMLLGPWQNSLVKDDIDAARKTELSTELLDKGSTVGVAASAADHEFREKGAERKESRRLKNDSSCGTRRDLTTICSCFFILATVFGWSQL